MTKFSLQSHLDAALAEIPDPENGLPDPVFAFALKIAPMINVDLFIRDDQGRNLLAWRDDPYGQGWHIPGGIIRFNEKIEERIQKTALQELGVTVHADPFPQTIREFFLGRGHFISLLYRCRLASERWDVARFVTDHSAAKNGSLGWIAGVPTHVYPAHETYRDLLQTR